MNKRFFTGIFFLVSLCFMVSQSYACPTLKAFISHPDPKFVGKGVLLVGFYGRYSIGSIVQCTWSLPSQAGPYDETYITWTYPDDNVDCRFSTPGGPYSVTLTVTDSEQQTDDDTCGFYVIEADLDISGVSDSAEEDPGGYVSLNDDDDDGDGKVDYDDGYNKDEIPGNDDDTNPDEDNLVEIYLSVTPSLSTGTMRLEFDETFWTGLRVWSSPTKGEGNMIIPNGDPPNVRYYKEWPVQSMPATLYVEGILTSVPRFDKLSLSYKRDGATIHTDTVNFTVVKVDLDMDGVKDDEYPGVTEEIMPGGFIALNADDDDDNEKADKDESGPITDEDNLVKITLRKVKPTALTGNVTLDTTEVEDRSKIKIWESQTKGGSPITLPATYATPTALPEYLWLEGFENSSSVGDITLALEYTIGGKTFDDKIKLTVIKVDVEVAGGDDDTYEIPSVKVPSKVPDDHFVTVKGEGNITLWATTIPDDLMVDETITWTGMTQHPLEKLQASKPRTTSGKFPATVNVCGRDAKDLTNWVVWSSLSPQLSGTSSLFGTSLGSHSGRFSNGYRAEARIEWTTTITPATIITNSDRPGIENQTRQPPPGGVEFDGGVPSGSEFKGWDISRRIRDRWLYGNDTKTPPEPLTMTQPGDPVDEAFMTPTDFPSPDTIGNDDRSSGDEDDNPYDGAPIRSYDLAGFIRYDSRDYFARIPGEDGDTLRTRQRFGEFVRVQLGNTWYRCSGFGVWRFDWAMERQAGQWDAEPGQTEAFDLTDPEPLDFY